MRRLMKQLFELRSCPSEGGLMITDNSLHSSKTDNGCPFFQDVKAYNDDTSVDFDLTMSEANMLEGQQEGSLKKFKLTTTIATSNMHLFDKKRCHKEICDFRRNP